MVNIEKGCPWVNPSVLSRYYWSTSPILWISSCTLYLKHFKAKHSSCPTSGRLFTTWSNSRGFWSHSMHRQVIGLWGYPIMGSSTCHYLPPVLWYPSPPPVPHHLTLPLPGLYLLSQALDPGWGGLNIPMPLPPPQLPPPLFVPPLTPLLFNTCILPPLLPVFNCCPPDHHF